MHGLADTDTAGRGTLLSEWPATVTSAFVATAAERADLTALRWRTPGGWASWSWRDYADRTARVAAALRDLGVEPGDRIVLMLRNRPEFHAVDMGALFAGAVPVSLYNTSSAEQVRYVTRHAGAAVALVEPDYLERFLAVRDQLPRLRHLVVVSHADEDAIAADDVRAAERGNAARGVVRFDALLRVEPVVLSDDAARAEPDDLATLIYTSGTTGPPKAVEITHANVAWTVRSLVRAVGHGVTGWRMVSCLPMAHIAERVATHYLHTFEGTEVTTCPDIRFLPQYLREVHPQAIFGVPLLWEKTRASIRAVAAANPEQREPFDAALRVGAEVDEARLSGRTPSPDLARRWTDADRLLAVVRELLGMDQVELAVTAAAPIAPEVVRFFRSLGVPLSELYGMSESTGPITWDPYDVCPGDVGHPIPGCEVRVALDGEVLARGGNVFAGYFKDAALTAETIDEEGWLSTGDLGVLEDGRLRIVGRKKDLIITEGGENVSPSNIETALRLAPLVGQACVAGDRRPYLVALLTVDPDALGAWAHEHERSETPPPELARLPELREEVRRQVDEVNRRFSRVEQVRRFAVLEGDWSADPDLLTATMKVRRHQVLARFAAEVDALYR